MFKTIPEMAAGFHNLPPVAVALASMKIEHEIKMMAIFFE